MLTKLVLHDDVGPINLPGIVVGVEALAAVAKTTVLFRDAVEQRTGQSIGSLLVVLHQLQDRGKSPCLIDVKLREKRRNRIMSSVRSHLEYMVQKSSSWPERNIQHFENL